MNHQWQMQDFPLGALTRWGRQPPMWALFNENGCENDGIGSRRGVRPERCPLDPLMITKNILLLSNN